MTKDYYGDEIIPLPSSSSEDEEEFDIGGESDASDEDLFPQASDSDSAPETVSFKTAEVNTNLLRKRTAEVIKTQKEERRKKRKEMHLKNSIQKEEKRKKIKENLLPDDMLAKLDNNIPPSEEIVQQELSDVEADRIKEDIVEKVVGVHGPTVFKCKVIPKSSQKPKVVSEAASNFRQKMLYGGRIRREKSTREAILKQEKRLAMGHIKSVHI
ncbi:uncharacterized protein LOC129217319 [Uloborus diversus]|uniref:uncharacterized protein LOC129217319 n=1 Tax=Uloborus diversus TaxID=327109 RepID=UPI0024099B1B|nr:uncharacterized protein LOC129217319 [Uloborus diversus]